MKVPEELTGEHHQVDVLVDDDAGGVVIGEIRVDAPPDALVELLRSGEVGRGEVDEDIGRHELLLLLSRMQGRSVLVQGYLQKTSKLVKSKCRTWLPAREATLVLPAQKLFCSEVLAEYVRPDRLGVERRVELRLVARREVEAHRLRLSWAGAEHDLRERRRRASASNSLSTRRARPWPRKFTSVQTRLNSTVRSSTVMMRRRRSRPRHARATGTCPAAR